MFGKCIYTGKLVISSSMLVLERLNDLPNIIEVLIVQVFFTNNQGKKKPALYEQARV